MCFDFKNQIIILIELDYSGIIDKHGKTKIFFAFGFPDLGGGTLDICFKKRINGEFRVRGSISDPAIEYFMFAMFRPGLRQAFQLDICYVFLQPYFFTVFDHIRILIVALNFLHLFQIQGKEFFLADFNERIGIKRGQRNFFHLYLVFARNLRHIGRYTAVKIKIVCGDDLIAFDKIIGQDACGDSFRIRLRNFAAD